MNKTINIYELLGLIKDGKAPKKIEYKGDTYIYAGDDYSINDNREDWLITKYDYFLTNFLTEEVEILEDKKEELELLSWQQIGYLDRTLEEIVKDINTQNRKTNGKINEIIKYLKDKEDKNN